MNKYVKTVFAGACLILLNGCQSLFQTQPPPDFVIEQDTSGIDTALSAMDNEDFVATLAIGDTQLSEKDQQRLLNWLNENQPSMIAIQGAAGSIRYKDLGEQRKYSLMKFVQAAQVPVDMVGIPYDATAQGRRVIIRIVPAILEQAIRQRAPIKIVRSGYAAGA